MRRATLAAASVAALLGGLPAVSDATEIRVMSTTDTVDAGLAVQSSSGNPQGPLVAQYLAANPGDTVTYTGVGTGRALDNAKNGQADVVITHAPSLEKQFVDGGFSTGPGKQIFFSDYVIVGPKTGKGSDVVPAADRNNAAKAYEDIAAAGATGGATFVSRNDNSGTNVAEQLIWGLTSVGKDNALSDPSTNSGASAEQRVPKRSDWYPYPTTGTLTGRDAIGQAANILRTDQCSNAFPNGGCFTMTDRGSFNRYLNNNPGSNLTIVAEKNAVGVPGGENLLVNPFSAYVVNPATSNGTDETVAAARRFIDFITSPSFQAFLPTFPNAVDPAFRPDAYPAVTVAGGLPQTAVAGQKVTLTGTASNRLPGAGTISGLPITLQSSTDSGTTWTDAGSTTSNSDGTYSLETTVAKTADYRFSLPDYAATTYNGFTANTQPLGTITVPAVTPTETPTPTPGPTETPTTTPSGGGTTPGGGTAPAPTPTPTPTPTASPTTTPRDTTAPRVTRVKLGRRKVSFRVSERATVKVSVQRIGSRRVKGKRRKTYKTVRRATIRATEAGTFSRRLKALESGRYRVVISATDAADNRGSARATKTVKR